MTKLQREVIKSLHPFIGPDLLVRKMMLKSVKISDADLHQAFTQRYGPKVEVLQILLNTHEEAEEVLQKLKAGAAFSTMVEKVSRDWASSLKGGKMPPLPLSSKLGAAVSRLQPGELSEVVQTPDGFHILKLVKALPMSPVRLEDVRDRLREESTEKTLRDQRNNWLKDLRLTADIQRHY
jgi:parvulin-like peptidyl-prolyl isomerase